MFYLLCAFFGYSGQVRIQKNSQAFTRKNSVKKFKNDDQNNWKLPEKVLHLCILFAIRFIFTTATFTKHYFLSRTPTASLRSTCKIKLDWSKKQLTWSYFSTKNKVKTMITVVLILWHYRKNRTRPTRGVLKKCNL